MRAVTAVMSLWRRLPSTVRAQAARFARVFAFAAVPAVIAGAQAHRLSWALLASVVTAAGETAWRQVVKPPEVAAAVAAFTPHVSVQVGQPSIPAQRGGS